VFFNVPLLEEASKWESVERPAWIMYSVCWLKL